jgi:hypothetical protein
VVTKRGGALAPAPFRLVSAEQLRNEIDQISRRNTMSDHVYLFIQVWLIAVLSILDGSEALLLTVGRKVVLPSLANNRRKEKDNERGQ